MERLITHKKARLMELANSAFNTSRESANNVFDLGEGRFMRSMSEWLGKLLESYLAKLLIATQSLFIKPHVLLIYARDQLTRVYTQNLV